jgi:hypothetical protein
MIKPTGRLGITGASKADSAEHKTFTLPAHSERSANVSQHYHTKVLASLNPSEARENAVRYPQTGLGG